MNLLEPKTPRRGIFTIAFLIWGAALIFNVALIAAIIWVAWHFISKFW